MDSEKKGVNQTCAFCKASSFNPELTEKAHYEMLKSYFRFICINCVDKIESGKEEKKSWWEKILGDIFGSTSKLVSTSNGMYTASVSLPTPKSSSSTGGYYKFKN
jgi:hypothetical protein